MMKEYCKKAGINGYSAESLRNAGAMSMFAYGVNEKDAAQRMGITTSHIKRYKNGAYRDNILQAADHMVKIRVDVPDQWKIQNKCT